MAQVSLTVVLYTADQAQSILRRENVPLDISLATTPLELVDKLRHLFPPGFKPKVVMLIVDGKRVHKSRSASHGFGYAQTSVVIRELRVDSNSRDYVEID